MKILIMIISQRIISNFAVYFGRNLETKPLSKVKRNLVDFLQTRASKDEFQQSFSAYQSYLHQTLEDNPGHHPHKLDLLDLVTKIYRIYRIPSKRLNKIHNHLTQQCLDFSVKQSLQQYIKVLTLLQRFNRGKALALFKKQKENIMTKMKDFSPSEVISLLHFLKEVHIDDALIRQTAIEMLFGQIKNLNIFELQKMLEYMAYSKKYINRDFLGKTGQRVFTLFRCGNIQERELPSLLAYLSEIEVNLHTRVIYVQELDDLYQHSFPSLFQSYNAFDDNTLNKLVSALRRSKYFDEGFLAKLTHIALKKSIHELTSKNADKRKDISLRTFLNILHTHAVFNYHQSQFKAYVMDVLKILMTQEQPLQPKAFFKLLWSLCVLYQRHQLAGLYPMIEKYISQTEKANVSQAYNIYYCYLYLRTTCPQMSQYRDHIHSLMKEYHLETRPSNTQMEVYNAMIQVGVPCIPQYNLNNLICDIMIPEWRSLRNVIVELHGFRHFCRNAKRLTGSNALKEKIISAEMYRYYYISVDEWLMAEDKKQFALDFLEHIDRLEESRLAQKKPVIVQTSKRVKNRPRVFRVSQPNPQLE